MANSPNDVEPGRSRLAGVGKTFRKVGRATVKGTKKGSGNLYSSARKATRAAGAGETGLYRLIELHSFNSAGDAAVAVSLAGTIFFAQPGEARGQVALFLGLTLLPFAIIAPLIGPFLDKFAHGRRWAIGATMAIRGLSCLVMADAIATENNVLLFPAALVCLIASKAYGVTRAAVVPRLLPTELTLVAANSRMSMAGVIGGAIGGGLAALIGMIGAEWGQRFTFVIFAAATVLAILLPKAADATAGEVSTGGNTRFGFPAPLVFSLRCNTGLRFLSGFLTMYLAFLLRQHPLPGWENRALLLMGIVIGAAGIGSTIAIWLGGKTSEMRPAVVGLTCLLVTVACCVIAAGFYNFWTAFTLSFFTGLCQGLAKTALDALIQDEVPDRVVTSTFARSETVLQLAWVVGGFLGIALPLIPQLSLGILTAIMLLWAGYLLLSWRKSKA